MDKLKSPITIERAFWMICGACAYAAVQLAWGGQYVEAGIVALCGYLFFRAARKIYAVCMERLLTRVTEMTRDAMEEVA